MYLNDISCERPRLCHVLIIEDNPDGRETLRILLELLGYRADVAADGLEGVQMALAVRPVVALVDIGLPRLDGYEVARRLRAAFGEDIFLIAQTGYGQPEDRKRALEAGFDVHLVKPLDLDELRSCLQVAEGGRGSAYSPFLRGPHSRFGNLLPATHKHGEGSSGTLLI